MVDSQPPARRNTPIIFFVDIRQVNRRFLKYAHCKKKMKKKNRQTSMIWNRDGARSSRLGRLT